jgi:hypothetical protein
VKVEKKLNWSFHYGTRRRPSPPQVMMKTTHPLTVGMWTRLAGAQTQGAGVRMTVGITARSSRSRLSGSATQQQVCMHMQQLWPLLLPAGGTGWASGARTGAQLQAHRVKSLTQPPALTIGQRSRAAASSSPQLAVQQQHQPGPAVWGQLGQLGQLVMLQQPGWQRSPYQPILCSGLWISRSMQWRRVVTRPLLGVTAVRL